MLDLVLATIANKKSVETRNSRMESRRDLIMEKSRRSYRRRERIYTCLIVYGFIFGAFLLWYLASSF